MAISVPKKGPLECKILPAVALKKRLKMAASAPKGVLRVQDSARGGSQKGAGKVGNMPKSTPKMQESARDSAQKGGQTKAPK